MTTHYNHLCRLCAKKNDLSKDLLDKTNKNILDILHQFIQISIKENDNLPTNICLDCEEKMVSFQLYILQCYKVQDYLNELCLENKLNIEDCQFEGDVIKSEVKNELIEDDILIAIQSDSIAELGADDFHNDACDDMTGSDNDDITIATLNERTFQNDACDDMAGSNNDDITIASLNERTFQNDACDDMAGSDNDDITIASLNERTFQNDACDDMAGSDNDDITIASLKERTSRQRQDVTEEAVAEFNRVLNKPNLDISDIVKLECTDCVMSFKSWDDICCHYAETHDTTPIVHCICGYTINSNSALTKHFTWHKKMNNEMRLLNKIDGDREALNFDDEGDNEDDVALTSLRPLKEENEVIEEETTQLNRIIENPSFKAKDIIKLQCRFCEKSFKSWSLLSSHYSNIHKRRPRATCLCGYIIRSTFKFYSHVATHKKRAIKNNSIAKIPKSKKCDKVLQAKMDLRVKDYIQLTCVYCDKECSSWTKLASHTQRVHKLPAEVICISCGLALKSHTSIYKHVKDHNHPTELSCDQCFLRAKSLEALNKHKLKHVPKSEQKFECSKCDKVFSYKEGLKSHEKSHIPIEERKVYQCDKCELRLTSSSAVTAHKRVVHEKVKSYVCDSCGFACGTSGELRQHVVIHSDERPFVCKFCSKRFKTNTTLKSHEDTHGEKSYECFICNRVLNSRCTLRRHLLVHEDKGRYVCTYCNKDFKRRETLKLHMRTHTGDKPLSCKWCDERFSYASTLRSHRLRCHPDKMAASHPTSSSSYQFSIVLKKPYAKDDPALVRVGINES